MTTTDDLPISEPYRSPNGAWREAHEPTEALRNVREPHLEFDRTKGD